MTPTEQLTITRNTCAQCGHSWQQRNPEGGKSPRCPNCGTAKWDSAPHDAEVERVKAAVESLAGGTK